MSVTITAKPVSIFYNEVSDQGRLEKLVNTLAELSVHVDIYHTANFSNELLFASDQQASSAIIVLTYRNSDAENLKDILAKKSPGTDLIVLRLESGPFDFVAEGLFHIEAGFLPEDLLSQWLMRKINFLKSFAELSSNLYSRAMHWSENGNEHTLLLEKKELFEAIYWLEQCVESHKELRDLSLKINYISASRQKHYPFADAYLHCGQGFKSIGIPVLQILRDKGLEIIAGNYISPKVYEHKFNELEIKRSNNFIFVYSPLNEQNKDCRRALSYARSLNKRIITLVEPDMKDCQMPPEIDKDNVVHVPTDWMYHMEFIRVIEEKIKTNADFVSAHTQYLIDAFEWIKHKKNYKFLIKESAPVQKATEWLAKGEESDIAPRISPLQKLYIERSISAHSLQRNIKLGAAIFFILLLVLGTLFFFFISNNESGEQTGSNQRALNMQTVSSAADAPILQQWQELNQNPTKVIPFLKAFYSKERFVKVIGSTNKQIRHIAKKVGENKYLISYGLSSFDLINSNGYLIKRFEVDDHEIFKAGFIPGTALILAAGTKSKISIWTQDGELVNKVNPGKNELCRDFVFLFNKQKIAFLIGDNTVRITDYELKTLAEFDTEAQILKIQDAGTDLLGVLQGQTYLTYNIPLGTFTGKASLPVYAKDVLFTTDQKLLLTANNKVFYNSSGEWQLMDLPFEVTGLTLSKTGALFLLNKDKGIYLLKSNGALLKTFSNKTALKYQSINHIEHALISIATDKNSTNYILETPDSFPPHFCNKTNLFGKPIKVFSTDKAFFLVEKQKIYRQEKDKSEPTWEFVPEHGISAYTFNYKDKKIIIGDEQGNLLQINESGKIVKQTKVLNSAISYLLIDERNNSLYCADTVGNMVFVTENGELVFQQKRHTDGISFLTFSNDGNYLLSAGEDHQMIIWDTDGKQYNKLRGPSSVVKFADFSGSNSFIISLGRSGDYTLWDIEGNVIRYERKEPEIQKAFFHSNGEFIVLSNENQLMGIDAKGKTLFDIALPENVHLHDAMENNQGDIELLCSDTEKNTYFSALLPLSKNTMEQQLALAQQL